MSDCDLLDYSPPGSSVHGILQTKNTGVVCHFLLQGIFLTQESNSCLLQVACIAGRLFTPEPSEEYKLGNNMLFLYHSYRLESSSTPPHYEKLITVDFILAGH